MNRLPTFALPILTAALLVCCSATASAAKPKYTSPVVTAKTDGRAVAIDVDIRGAKQLYLVVGDAGNGYSCDWADWAEPRLLGAGGKELKLTELKWKSATTGFGQAQINKNVEGGELKLAGESVPYGIGVHARSVVVYDLPEGYERFRARGGLDDGGASQQACGGTASVQFLVYTETPDAEAAVAQGASSHEPEQAVKNLDVATGLAATLFASEPMITNPTNLDVDERGRVWICDVMNYRGHKNDRPAGDRIMILEDTDGDGVADKSKVYYQGRDVDTAMGICVLGNRVIVSATPNIIVFTDENGDDVPDEKEYLFTKSGQFQHDHSLHSFLFGPDGKLYWNFGNTGQALHDKDGQPVVDLAGNKVVDNGRPYFGGMPFRCNLDGSELEVLAHNFRNNYEVTVDSFGTLWQSDNDDDGNRAVRINYVMEHGNFGYKDQMTGAAWKSPRTGMHEEIPLRHWHLRDPGVVPNLLQTGAGSPTGITVYEGRLLPEIFWDQVIHCDAGPSVMRAYPVKDDGAGYSAEIENILFGARDNWFRPADVCVAPDGSLIVTDWYDPGVGGHQARDMTRGRIFRVAPPGSKYTSPKHDFSTPAGAAKALASPNAAVRYLAWTALHKAGKQAEPALLAMYNGNENPRLQARALWLLAKMPGGEAHVRAALDHQEANLRITALRAARQLQLDLPELVGQLVKDPSPQVRRECAIALRFVPGEAAAPLWAELAAQHDGKDRWYLEALGIGADLHADACFSAWQQAVGSKWNTPGGRDIVWRSRSAAALPLLAELILSAETTPADRLRYFRAFDFHPTDTPEAKGAKTAVLLQLVISPASLSAEEKNVVTRETAARLGSGVNVANQPQLAAALDKTLDSLRGTSEFVALVDKFSVAGRYPELLALAQSQPSEQSGVEAIQALLRKGEEKLIAAGLADKDPAKAAGTAESLGNSAAAKVDALLWPVANDPSAPSEVRRQAVRGLAKTRGGAVELVRLAKAGKLEESLRSAAAFHLTTAPWDEIRGEALKLFPLPPGKNNQPLPAISELIKRKGSVERGREVYAKAGTCNKCHQIGKEGKEIGPNLSEIGSKLSREAFFESILFPSAGISHNYETYAVVLESGNVVSGIITSRTDDSLTIKNNEGLVRTFPTAEIEEMKKLPISMMPADLQKQMTVEELVDVVEFLTTLKKK